MKLFVSTFKFILFWMIVFTVQRIIFFFVYIDRLREIPVGEQMLIFIKGLRLDLSITGYILLIPLLLLLIQLLFPSKTKLFSKITNTYTYVLLFIVVLFGLIDIGIYKEWGSKLNSRAVEFLLLSPGEALASGSSSPIFLMSLSLLLQIILFIYIYKKRFQFEFEKEFIYLLRIPSILFIAFISVMMLRGGLQLAPINQSAAYFSKHTIVNHASLNTEWNLMHSVIENHFSNENPYLFMDDQEAKLMVDSLYHQKNEATSLQVLNTAKPNIVFIILESFTSDVIEHFGGDKGVAPNISKLADDGLSFENIYASGDRTDKGMIAILSAFPTQAVRTIIQQPDKFEKLPSLPKTLAKNGYSSSFFYGGESEFANFKSYLVSTGIEKIIDKKDFESSQMNSKWGAHDGYMFDRALLDLKDQKEPFISILLTLSSHEPFEIPEASPYTGNDLPSKFRKAAHYTDKCVINFIEKSKKEDWYKNTLFVIVADHGHRLPREYESAYDVRKFRIPLIFYGEVIKNEYRKKRITQIGSQTDIANTLLHQLNSRDTTYKWSKNLLNPQESNFAFYTYDNGIGWVDLQASFTMDNVNQNITSRSNDSTLMERKIKTGKAYMQRVFSEYLSY